MALENFSKEIYKNKLLFGNEMKSWDQPFLNVFPLEMFKIVEKDISPICIIRLWDT